MRHFVRLLLLLLTAVLWVPAGSTIRAVAQDAGADDPQSADVDDLLRRLDEIERETRDASGQSTGARTERMAVVFEQSDLGTYPFGNDRVRYLVTRAILINLGDESLTVSTEDLVLTADGDEFRLSGLHEELRTSTVYTGREQVHFEEVAPPAELAVPPGGTAAVWLMFSGLASAPRVPEMTLKVPIGDQIQEININDYQRGILGLREERLGPDDCLALARVTGELNTINAANFADELDRLGSRGVARVVVSWGENASPLSQPIRDWLLTSRRNTRGLVNTQLPDLPASISELHFAALPGSDNRSRPYNDNSVVIHADEASAVLAALRTACEAIPRDELRRQIAAGPPLTRAAALTHGGSRLAPEDLPLVLRSLRDPDEHVRRGAIGALAHFSESAAINALIATVRDGPDEQSLAALEALASSRYPAAHSRLLEFIDEAPRESRAEIINVLSRFPRPEWSGMLFEYTRDEDAGLRLAALRAIVRIGDVELGSVLTDALHDADPSIRDFAFAHLAAGSDAGSEAAAMEFALALLESGPPNETVTSLLTRTRDQRAVPLLLRRLDEPGEHRADVIPLLARVAGHAAIDMLLERFDEFDQNEQERALGVLHELHAPQARELSFEAIAGGKQNLIPLATRILAGDGDPEAVRVLADVLRSDNQQSWSWACNALRMIGTREARQALREARESRTDGRRNLAAEALRRLDRESPAAYVTDQGIVRMSELKFDEAEAMFSMAIQFDEEYAAAHSQRGFVRLRLEKISEAQADFEQAIAIDPFDAQAVAGFAIARTLQGDYLAGVQFIEENASRFPDDPVYAYNSACVYGRALEQVEDLAPSDERTARLQDYRVRALLLLNESIDGEFNDWELLRTDPDLDSLRELEEFQDLLREHAEEPGPGNAPGAEAIPEEKLG